MKSKKIVSLLLTGAMTAALLAVPAQAVETPPIRVNSYKGSTLEVGERSGLIIGPGGTDYTVTSSAPDIVAVEQVLTFWVAVAKAEGTAEITATTTDGQTGGVTITVVSAESAKGDETEDTSAAIYSEVRLELIRLINQTRIANGVSELPVTINGGGTVTVTAADKKLPSLTILKRDAQTKEVIPGTVFEIKGIHYHYHDDVTTGPDGKAVLTNIPMDSYEITEKSVPAPYCLPEDEADRTQTISLNVTIHSREWNRNRKMG